MITVVKRNGERVPLDIAKIQRQVAHGCRGIDGVSPSMVEIKAQIELHDGMTTQTIDELLLKAMVNLIDETENPEINNVNYQYVAGRQRHQPLRPRRLRPRRAGRRHGPPRQPRQRRFRRGHPVHEPPPRPRRGPGAYGLSFSAASAFFFRSRPSSRRSKSAGTIQVGAEESIVLTSNAGS